MSADTAAPNSLNLPNLLTWLRILMIPLIVGVFYVPDAWLSPWERNLFATIAFTVAAITDWLDGYLARKLGQMSAFGAFLDPVADKLMVTAALILLVQLDRTHAAIAIVIIGREIAISALREWMAKLGRSGSVAVNLLGKIKTGAQMVAIPLLLYHDPIAAFNPMWLGNLLIWLATLLTLLSMLYYMKLAGPIVSEGPLE